ncbi:MAG: FGGY-family carbohydrate kinase [Clostridia bacterium]|nr:FGGY-family carbohydrate kinase [Clostridia bacterium]
MDTATHKAVITAGRTALGIEFGSTRIKAVLVGENHQPIASGSHEWENRLENGLWTYSQEDIWEGLKRCYGALKQDVRQKYGVCLKTVGALGISGMMHGYLVFDEHEKLLAPFRTWRNTTTGPAAEELTELLQFNIPQRWSIAHLYQALLNGEEHVNRIRLLTTLAGYVHWKLTGKKVLGVGEASGVFPVDSAACAYHMGMMAKFNAHIKPRNLPWNLEEILPEVLSAGEGAGLLTREGARLLDPEGDLEAGIPLCPPEGDAGTGMVATNSVARRTGNISAGTSVFAMIVLEKELAKVHMEIDMVTTPAGAPVAMAHCNSCTSDLNAWVGLFGEAAATLGMNVDMDTLFGALYRKALEGDPDCGGLVAYNYFAGEPVTGLEEGRPLFLRLPDASFTLANFMRAHLYAAVATLKLGMDILLKEEKVEIDQIYGHGGLFKTKGVGQRMMAAALNTPVSVLETAGEGGAWGMALLAAYMLHKESGETLDSYLNGRVFSHMAGETQPPDPADAAGFSAYMDRYVACLPVEKAAVAGLKA